jgi:hypothetical protein
MMIRDEITPIVQSCRIGWNLRGKGSPRGLTSRIKQPYFRNFLGDGFRGASRWGLFRPAFLPGHPFGLDLSEQDRKALIVFLKTL